MKTFPKMAFPKPAPIVQVEEDRAKAFEQSESTSIPTASRSGRTTRSKLKRESLGERVTIYLPPTLAAVVRQRCSTERRSLSDGLTEAVEAWMNRSKHG